MLTVIGTSLKMSQKERRIQIISSTLTFTMKLLLKLSYNGTNYHGLVAQPNQRTIYSELHKAFNKIFKNIGRAKNRRLSNHKHDILNNIEYPRDIYHKITDHKISDNVKISVSANDEAAHKKTDHSESKLVNTNTDYFHKEYSKNDIRCNLDRHGVRNSEIENSDMLGPDGQTFEVKGNEEESCENNTKEVSSLAVDISKVKSSEMKNCQINTNELHSPAIESSDVKSLAAIGPKVDVFGIDSSSMTIKESTSQELEHEMSRNTPSHHETNNTQCSNDFNQRKNNSNVHATPKYQFISTITCAGRTDKGVHASNMVLSLPASQKLPYHVILNRLLPEDIEIKGMAYVEDEFCARIDCKLRVYRYYFTGYAYRNKNKRSTSSCGTDHYNTKHYSCDTSIYDTTSTGCAPTSFISTGGTSTSFTSEPNTKESLTKESASETDSLLQKFTDYSNQLLNKLKDDWSLEMFCTRSQEKGFYKKIQKREENQLGGKDLQSTTFNKSYYNRPIHSITFGTVDEPLQFKDTGKFQQNKIFYMETASKSFLHNQIRRIFHCLSENVRLSNSSLIYYEGMAMARNLIFVRAEYGKKIDWIKTPYEKKRNTKWLDMNIDKEIFDQDLNVNIKYLKHIFSMRTI